MQLEEFNEITQEAKRRMSVYLNMNTRATHMLQDFRKEDFLNYWIAVEAYERGKYEFK